MLRDYVRSGTVWYVFFGGLALTVSIVVAVLFISTADYSYWLGYRLIGPAFPILFLGCLGAGLLWLAGLYLLYPERHPLFAQLD